MSGHHLTEPADLGVDPASGCRRWHRHDVYAPPGWPPEADALRLDAEVIPAGLQLGLPVGRGETIDTYWLAGEHGVASAWFADIVELLGHSVCDGLVIELWQLAALLLEQRNVRKASA